MDPNHLKPQGEKLKIWQQQYKENRDEIKKLSGKFLEEGSKEAAQRDLLFKHAQWLRIQLALVAQVSLPVQLALAIYLALDNYEMSYDRVTGKYLKDYEFCIQEAVKLVGLPTEIWYIAYLAAGPHGGWSNDTCEWADSILSGTYEEDFKALDSVEEGK